MGELMGESSMPRSLNRQVEGQQSYGNGEDAVAE